MPSVNYFSQGTSFCLKNPRKVATWLKSAATDHNYSLKQLNYIFCSDKVLLKLNQGYLNHNTLTDIITFDNSEMDREIEADIFISVQRVRENARTLNLTFEDELHRVIIHGLLHLMGYSDKTAQQKARMRKKEDAYLSLY